MLVLSMKTGTTCKIGNDVLEYVAEKPDFGLFLLNSEPVKLKPQEMTDFGQYKIGVSLFRPYGRKDHVRIAIDAPKEIKILRHNAGVSFAKV